MPPSEPNASSAAEDTEALQKRLFDDISTLTGMPFPNQLYRVLGKKPHQLESYWRRLRGGLAVVGAPTLRTRLVSELPSPGLPSNAQNTLDGHSQEMLIDVLDAYDMGNSCNAVLVRLLLEGTPGHPDSPLVQPSREQRLSEHQGLPPMLELEAMSEKTRAQVHRLAQLVDPHSDVVPSVFRHFANDEALLDAVVSALDAASTNGELDRLYAEVGARVTKTMAEWPTQVAPIVDADTRGLLEPFSTVIPRMLAVSAVLRTISENTSAL